jgi:hypothetical protein
MLHVYFPAHADILAGVRDRIAEETIHWLFDGVRSADVPGWSFTEIYAGDRLPRVDDRCSTRSATH